MYELSLEDLKELHKTRPSVIQYAMDHKEELLAREHSYVLYGPYHHALGASVPCNTVSAKRTRALVKKTRRKDYVIYHLDENYHVLRTTGVLDNAVRHTFHHFELDGVVYAYSYEWGLNLEVRFLKFAEGKPISYGMISNGHVFTQFYEYMDDKRMLVTNHRYYPVLERTIYGGIPNPEAPIGDPDSCAERYCYEKPAEDTDFSRWFK